ncbi:MAG: hypothetical protein HZT43_16330 [Exiguobacterium profundum]|nr:MAG: hypothetical protein HZT43_16330 [Exiguobacterium profundum]
MPTPRLAPARGLDLQARGDHHPQRPGKAVAVTLFGVGQPIRQRQQEVGQQKGRAAQDRPGAVLGEIGHQLGQGIAQDHHAHPASGRPVIDEGFGQRLQYDLAAHRGIGPVVGAGNQPPRRVARMIQ